MCYYLNVNFKGQRFKHLNKLLCSGVELSKETESISEPHVHENDIHMLKRYDVQVFSACFISP